MIVSMPVFSEFPAAITPPRRARLAEVSYRPSCTVSLPFSELSIPVLRAVKPKTEATITKAMRTMDVSIAVMPRCP